MSRTKQPSSYRAPRTSSPNSATPNADGVVNGVIGETEQADQVSQTADAIQQEGRNLSNTETMVTDAVNKIFGE
jgi:hypothetical protein